MYIVDALSKWSGVERLSVREGCGGKMKVETDCLLQSIVVHAFPEKAIIVNGPTLRYTKNRRWDHSGEGTPGEEVGVGVIL